jgi:CDP-6-deoxy-D-xylo-4-hexulose-3-dehydrase
MEKVDKKITLVNDTINNQDIDKLIEWLKTYPKLTKGEKTVEFENAFSKWIGCKYSVFVNSGSSANLLMIAALKELGYLKYNKIVCPALSWATTLAPIIQYGIIPILVDCNLEDLSVDLNQLEEIFKSENVDALILVPVLGLSPNFNKVIELTTKYNVELIVDNCESQGTTFNNVKIGNFGLMTSFSTYFGHIMATIEGGFITTDNEDVYNCLLQLRSHGWMRDQSVEKQQELKTKYNLSDFSALYEFFVPGYNLRPTEIQSTLGIEQLKKVDSMIEKRNKNFHIFKEKLSPYIWFPVEVQNSFTASFCIPLIVSNVEQKSKIIQSLNENNIDCRPLISGSMGKKVFYVKQYGVKELPNASKIDECGLYVPNHPELSIDDIELICNCIIKGLNTNQ